MTPLEGFAQTPFGRIHYIEQGQGQPLLLMHSNGCSSHEFRPAMQRLSQRFRCIAWDMPGQGDSDPISRHHAIGDYAAAAAALLDVLSLPSVFVLGNSIGGAIAADLAAHYPDRVIGAVISELPLGRDTDWWAANWTMIEKLFANPADTFEAMSRRYRALTEEGFSRLLTDRFKAGRSMLDVMWAGREGGDMVEATLEAIRCPVLFVLGDKGVAVASADRFTALTPSGQVKVIPDSGHFPFTDDPEAAASAVLDFAET